ncbi:MAG TPA: ATP-binding protein [Gemmatimonadaceae bacterium]|nr:ATP-binding protein [Gemmatimonadaceae bacterium]
MPRRLFLGFLLGLLILAGMAALLGRSVLEFGDERAEVMDTRGDIDALNVFLATVEDAETGQRGYLLTGDSAYLLPYRAAIAAIGTRLAVIEQSTSADASRRVWARSLRTHVTAKLTELSETIRLRRQSEADALALVRAGNGQREMSAIRSIVRELSQAYEIRLDAQIHEYDASVERLTLQLATAITLQFLLAGLLFWLARRLTAEHDSLAASEERFHRLSDGSTDGVIVSRGGVIVEANAAFCRMFGAADEQALIGVAGETLVAEHDRNAAMRAVRENRTTTYDLTCVRLDGSTFEGQVTGRPITYHGAPARISILRDITEWTRVNRLKNEFVSTVSHELRTPLTSIHGALRLMEGGGLNPVSSANLVTIARTNCERLIRLINDMLDLDKIEAGKLELRCSMLTPDDLVQTALDSLRAMADEYRVRLEAVVQAPTPFSGDRDRILQVLTNLVSNAVKFAPTDTTVTVTAQTHVLGDRVRFSVANAGQGIAASDMGRLFSRFQQIDGSDARRRGGTGLGLTIAKAIVEQHGGTIGVESTPNVLTTFWFEIPIAITLSPSPDIALTH